MVSRVDRPRALEAFARSMNETDLSKIVGMLPKAADECTFISIADVELKKESAEEFKKWFSEVNRKILSRYRGFLGRILIESPDGRHKIIIMTADKESFLAIRASQEHKEIHAKALTFMTRPPAISFYKIAAR